MYPSQKLFPSATIVAATMITLAPHVAVAVDIDWDAAQLGAQNWDDPNNWVGGTIPDSGANTGVLVNATADRTITVDSNPASPLKWDQSTGGGVVNKVLLGADWTPATQIANGTPFTNSTGDPAAMALDLNGFSWSTFSGGTLALPAMTITGPGTWEQDRKIEFNGNTMVGPDGRRATSCCTDQSDTMAHSAF